MCVIIDSSNSKGDGSMKFIISGKNITVTEGLKTAVQDKLSKLERYFTPDTEVVVTLSVEKERQKIEVTIPVKGNIIRSEQVIEKCSSPIGDGNGSNPTTAVW